MVKRHIGWLFVTISVLADAVLISVGFNIAWWLRYEIGLGGVVSEANFVWLGAYGGIRGALTGAILCSLAVAGVYRSARGKRFVYIATRITQAILAALGLFVIALFMARISVSSRLLLGYAGSVVLLLLVASRVVSLGIKQMFWRRGIGVVNVLVVGDGVAAREIMHEVLHNQNRGRKLVGYLSHGTHSTDDAIVVDTAKSVFVPVLGHVDDLERVMLAHNIRQVVVALPGSAPEVTQQAVYTCRRQQVDFRLAPELFGVASQHVNIDPTFERPVLDTSDHALAGRQRRAKRVLDIVLSLLLLVPFSAIMLVAAVLIKLDSPGPVLFRQRRMTRYGSIFWVYKFRTIHVDAEQLRDQLQAANEASRLLFKIRDDPRLTRIGKLLRRASLDEMPQIFNILLGEMSWVGPRPPLPSEVELYEDWHKRRLGTTTGLTGLWQVSGRSLLSFDEMVKLDLYYIENWSIWFDLKILLMTIPSVFKMRGAY